MPRRGMTDKPCPGCGDASGRPTDKVCMACQTLISEAIAARKRQAEQTVLRLYHTPGVPHEYPYLHGAPSVEGREVNRLFDRMVHAVAEPSITTDWTELRDAYPERPTKLFVDRRRHSTQGYSYHLPVILLRPEAAEALDQLHLALQVAFVAARTENVQYGASLLVRLGTGELSMDEFTKRTVG